MKRRQGFPRAILSTAIILSALSGCARQVVVPEVATIAGPEQLSPAPCAAVYDFRLERSTSRGEGPLVADMVSEALTRMDFAEKVLRVRQLPANEAEAARLAEESSCSLAVVGDIDEFFRGERTAASRVRLTVSLVSAGDGERVWQLSGRLKDDPVQPKDKIFFVDGGRPAKAPLELARAVADEMARVLVGKPTQVTVESTYPVDTTSPRDMGGWKSY